MAIQSLNSFASIWIFRSMLNVKPSQSLGALAFKLYSKTYTATDIVSRSIDKEKR